MIAAKLVGLDEVAEKVRLLPSTIGVEAAFDEAGRRMEAILRDRTPSGYNQKLGSSVLYQATEDGFVVGYEAGVETAGNESLDSATRPRTRGRSVLRRRRWASTEELQSVLEESVDEGFDEVLSVIERSVASGLS